LITSYQLKRPLALFVFNFWLDSRNIMWLKQCTLTVLSDSIQIIGMLWSSWESWWHIGHLTNTLITLEEPAESSRQKSLPCSSWCFVFTRVSIKLSYL